MVVDIKIWWNFHGFHGYGTSRLHCLRSFTDISSPETKFIIIHQLWIKLHKYHQIHPKKKIRHKNHKDANKKRGLDVFFLAGWMDLQFSPVFVEIPADSFRRQIGCVNKVAGLSPCPIFGNKQNHRWYNPLDLNIGDSPGFGNPGQVFFIEALKLESCNRQFGRDVSALTFFVPCRKRLEKKRFRGGALKQTIHILRRTLGTGAR